jgi:hypothetical protein
VLLGWHSVESVRLGKADVFEGTRSELFGVVNRQHDCNCSVAALLVALIQVPGLQNVSILFPIACIEVTYQLLEL